MAIGSTLTKGIRRIRENNKPQLEFLSSDSSKTNSSFRKGSNQGDSDSSEATSFSSSVHGSTTSSGASSTTRYSTGIESGSQQKKTLDKLSSQKVAASRPSRRRPQSRFMSLPDDDPPVEQSDESPDIQKPMQKFTRSGSLRSLKILRKKNMPPSESKKSSAVKDLHSKKATFSSALKDSKFPEQVEAHASVKKSEEVISAAKLCSYEHCSLHGNHHHHEPPLKRFSFLKRRSSKDQKGISPQTRATDKHSIEKKEVKVTKKVSKENSVDFSVEFYAKTRSESSFEPSRSRDDVHLADIMFGINGRDQIEVLQRDDQDRSVVNIDEENADVEGKEPSFNNDSQMSMWRFIHRHMVSGHIDQLLEEKQSCFDDEDGVNQGTEVQKMFAIKNIVKEAIEKILLPEEEGPEKNKGDDQTEPNQAVNDMRRFITELEKAERKLDSDKRGHVPLVPKPEPEAEIVSLRSQTTGEKKNSNEWMLDYALQQVVAELAPTQKRKVSLLVKSFELVTPKLAKEVAI